MKAMVVFWLVMTLGLSYAKGMISWRPDCCTELGYEVSPYMLKYVKDVTVQKGDGICNLKAIVLHFKKKSSCIDPGNEVVRQWLCSQKKYRKLQECSSKHFRAKEVKPAFNQ